MKPLVYDINDIRCKAISKHLDCWGLAYQIAKTEANFIEQLNDPRQNGFSCVIVAAERLEIIDDLSSRLLTTQLPILLIAPLFSDEFSMENMALDSSLIIHSPIKSSAFLDVLATAHHNTITPVAKADDEDRSFDFNGSSILLADDNEVNRMVAELLLMEVNVAVDLAEDGQIALDMLSQNHYDLVFMDCQMPNMDGYEATAAIRQLNDPQKRDITIIAMTANAMKGDREQCVAAGMDDYISKPVDAKALYTLMDKWLNVGEQSAPLQQRK